MRANRWLACLVLGLGLVGPLWGQRAVTFGPNYPIHNQVIDTTNTAVPIAQPQYLPSRIFSSFTSFFPSVSRLNAKPVLGSSQFPAPQDMPGSDYLKNFQFRRGVPINP